jgi:hypothetical protein
VEAVAADHLLEVVLLMEVVADLVVVVEKIQVMKAQEVLGQTDKVLLVAEVALTLHIDAVEVADLLL